MMSKVYLNGLISGQTKPVFLIVAVAAGLAGACSADVSRFNFNDSPTTGALPTPSESVYGARSGLGKAATDQPFQTASRGGSTSLEPRYGAANGVQSDATPTLAPARETSTKSLQPYTPPRRTAMVPPIATTPYQQPTSPMPSTAVKETAPAASAIRDANPIICFHSISL